MVRQSTYGDEPGGAGAGAARLRCIYCEAKEKSNCNGHVHGSAEALRAVIAFQVLIFSACGENLLRLRATPLQAMRGQGEPANREEG